MQRKQLSKEKQYFFLTVGLLTGFDFYKLQVAEGEDRTSLLQREVERLSQALLKAQEDESLLKEKTSSLKKSLQEAAASHSSTQSRLAALQKTLSESEQAKRLLQVSDTEGKQGCDLKKKKLDSDDDDYSAPLRNKWMKLGRQ